MATALGGIMIVRLLAAEMDEKRRRKEGFAAAHILAQLGNFYPGTAQKHPLAAFKSPSQGRAEIYNINLDNTGSQLLAYQLYQQATNAATPTAQQLMAISGQSQEQTGPGLPQLEEDRIT